MRAEFRKKSVMQFHLGEKNREITLSFLQIIVLQIVAHCL